MNPAGLAAACALLSSVPRAAGDDWPQFRGPHARGVADGHALVERFDVAKGENVRWRVPVAGLAHSSPVISKGRVFVTSAVRKAGEAELKVGLYGDPSAVESEGEHELVVVALDQASGAEAWRRVVWSGTPKHARHPKSSHAASTPATDGERLVVHFGTEGLYCLDLDGKELWKRDLGDHDAGPYDSKGIQWGYAASPVIHEGKVLVQCDVLSQGFVAAFDVATGEELWRTKREDVSTWSTPTVDVREGRAQVICNGFRHIGGYDLATGKELWKLVGGGDAPVPAPLVVEDMVLVTNAHGGPAPLYAIHAEAEGLISPEHESMIWFLPTGGIYMQTPLAYGDSVYLLSDAGVLACRELATGEARWRERLGDGSTGFTASMVAGDGKLYATSEEGTVHVLAAGETFAPIGKSELGETCMATPAISGGVVFWRTRGHVVAIGAE